MTVSGNSIVTRSGDVIATYAKHEAAPVQEGKGMIDHIPPQIAAYGSSPRRLIPAKSEYPHLDRMEQLHAPLRGETEQDRQIRVGLGYTD